MATSGWQNEQTVLTRSSWYYNGNISVNSISHEGTNLHVTGTIAFCPRGSFSSGAYYYQAIYVTPQNGSQTQIVAANERLNADKHANFDVWIGGVSETTTSISFSVRFYLNGYMDTTKYWTLNFDQSTVAPSGLSATWRSHTWNSITGSVNLSSYGIPSATDGRYIELGVMSSSNTAYGAPYRLAISKNTTSATITVNNNSSNNNFGTIKGMTAYKIGAYASNTSKRTSILNGTVYYTPPAPGALSYTHETGTTVYNLNYALDSGNNQSDYDVKEYTQQIEISSDGSTWTATDYALATTGIAKKAVNIDYGETLYVRAHQVYQNQYSIYSNITITNNDEEPAKVHTYGSVAQKTKEFKTIYASVDGQAKKLKKLYASVDGVAKLIYQAED